MLHQKPTLGQLISVSTIDAFQGQEGDLVILSCVRTSANDIGFVSDMRRLNVALTRAKSSLWIVCKCEAVSKFNFWKALLKNAKERGCYTDNLQDALALE
jgi:senataxin